MSIKDSNGLVEYEIGRVHDVNETIEHEISKVFDWDGTTNHEIWTSRKDLLDYGNRYQSVTGDYVFKLNDGIQGYPTDHEGLHFNTAHDYKRDGAAYTNKKIDVSGFDALYAEVDLHYAPDYNSSISIGITSSIGGYIPSFTRVEKHRGLYKGIVRLSLNGITGAYHIAVHDDMASVNVHKIWLE